MTKVIMVDMDQIESEATQKAEIVFDNAMDLLKEHGVCYFRLTVEDGMIILHPRYNAKINGVISDA